MKKILFLDVETSGYSALNLLDRSNNYEYQIVSIGLVVTKPGSWKEIDRHYVEIKWNGSSAWDPGAEKIHKLSKDHLEEYGLIESDAVAEISNFILKHFNPDHQIMVGGHNVSTFDRHFLVSLFNKYGMQIRLSGRAIDTFSVGMTLLNCENSDQLFELIGVTRGEHNALEDTRLALKAIRLTSKLFSESVM